MPESILMQAATIRSRSLAIRRWVEAGHSNCWTVDPACLEDAAQVVATITRARFPDLNVPGHSRWRHFEAGGEDRALELTRTLVQAEYDSSSIDALLARVDLCMVSVLLDAGAGALWRFTDRQGRAIGRSEGLAIATIEAFMRGAFAEDAEPGLRVDATVLERFEARELARLFQHSSVNPLDGLEGRLEILNRLGRALRARGLSRPAELYLPLLEAVRREASVAEQSGNAPQGLSAAAMLESTVTGLAPVWLQASDAPDGSRGDLWHHPAARDEDDLQQPDTQGWVPFHKLSQWLCYSLIEPLAWAGIEVSDQQALTGLPEYRNGGLLIDTGVLRLRDPDDSARIWGPGDRLVIEWRALTVSLIDELADRVRAQLGRDRGSLPLASILEGGTWAAGRELAQARRGGRPPLSVDTAGSVF